MAYKFVYKPKTRCTRITVYDTIYADKKVVEELFWYNLPMAVIIKWSWYFKYREALLRVKYPRMNIVRRDWDIEPEGNVAQNIRLSRIKKELKNARRMVTKISNAIEEYELEQSKTLIPHLSNPKYVRTKEKLIEYTEMKNSLEAELEVALKENPGG